MLCGDEKGRPKLARKKGGKTTACPLSAIIFSQDREQENHIYFAVVRRRQTHTYTGRITCGFIDAIESASTEMLAAGLVQATTVTIQYALFVTLTRCDDSTRATSSQPTLALVDSYCILNIKQHLGTVAPQL